MLWFWNVLFCVWNSKHKLLQLTLPKPKRPENTSICSLQFAVCLSSGSFPFRRDLECFTGKKDTTALKIILLAVQPRHKKETQCPLFLLTRCTCWCRLGDSTAVYSFCWVAFPYQFHPSIGPSQRVSLSHLTGPCVGHGFPSSSPSLLKLSLIGSAISPTTATPTAGHTVPSIGPSPIGRSRPVNNRCRAGQDSWGLFLVNLVREMSCDQLNQFCFAWQRFLCKHKQTMQKKSKTPDNREAA